MKSEKLATRPTDDRYEDYLVEAFANEAKRDTDKLAAISLAVGGLLWTFTGNAIAGLAAGGFIMLYSDRAVRESNRALEAIEKTRLAAPFLHGDSFQEFRRQYGDALVLDQLREAHEYQLPLHSEPEDYLFENYPELETPEPTKRAELPGDAALAVVDLADAMGRSLKPTIVSAMPRSGKGVLLANAWRAAKRHHPDLRVYVIDPKNHPSEAGYWEGCDRVLAIRFDQIPVNCGDTITAIEQFINEWRQDPAAEKLLIFDEQLLAESKLPKWYRSYVPALVKSEGSSGETFRRYLWLVMHSPQIKDIGLSGGSRSIYVQCAIATNRQTEGMNSAAWMGAAKRSGFIPSIPVDAQFAASPRGTLCYSSLLNSWVALPDYPVPSPTIQASAPTEQPHQPEPPPTAQTQPQVSAPPEPKPDDPWVAIETELTKQITAIGTRFESGELPASFLSELKEIYPQLQGLIRDRREDLLRIILLSIDKGFVKARHVQQLNKKCFSGLKAADIRSLFNELDAMGIGQVIGDDDRAGYRLFSTDDRDPL